MENRFRNHVGNTIESKNGSWNFGGNVPSNFEDHVSRSVPLYEEGHDLIVNLSDFFVKAGSLCYDLGCSTGRLSSKIYEHNKEKNVRVIAIDSESDMIGYAKSKYGIIESLEFECSSLTECVFEKSDLIIAYYTMQFIQPRHRQEVFCKIYESLNWGGAFILFEKVRANDARFQDILTSLYLDYKLERDFSADEIIAKSRSLKGVLEPFSTQGNVDLLRRAGFVDIISIAKMICFEGFLAVK
jgi:tRNA (cmo5U34)-methyltransferase